MSSKPQTEEQLLGRAIARLRAGILAIVFGLVSGTGLMLATLWLVVRGGPQVGQHLVLLNQYFPGYHVTWLGSIVGFLYAGVIGAITGWLLGRLYNFAVDLRGSATRSRSI